VNDYTDTRSPHALILGNSPLAPNVSGLSQSTN
jgi:hypothetical protein